MGVSKKLLRKERFHNWWKNGGNVQMLVTVVFFIILIVFSHNSLIVGITFCIGALWGFVRAFFKAEHRYFVLIMSVWILYKGILEILRSSFY